MWLCGVINRSTPTTCQIRIATYVFALFDFQFVPIVTDRHIKYMGDLYFIKPKVRFYFIQHGASHNIYKTFLLSCFRVAISRPAISCVAHSGPQTNSVWFDLSNALFHKTIQYMPVCSYISAVHEFAKSLTRCGWSTSEQHRDITNRCTFMVLCLIVSGRFFKEYAMRPILVPWRVYCLLDPPEFRTRDQNPESLFEFCVPPTGSREPTWFLGDIWVFACVFGVLDLWCFFLWETGLLVDL